MSSIAYITDRDMIEYHRLHGNKKIVFWRPSSQKNFQHFYIGDYLFFLTKGTEKGKNKEKGIIGYGRCFKERAWSVQQAWNQYGIMCGYGSLEQFQNAVISVNKAHELPKQIHCLLLERVIFFQAPIYLSEFSIHISKQIESYIYLDQERVELDVQLLEKAMEIGTDMWNSDIAEGDQLLRQDRDILTIQAIHSKIHADFYTSYELKKLQAFAYKQIQEQRGSFLSQGKEDFISWKNGQICFYIPCVMSLKHWKRNLLFCIAKAQLYREKLKGIHATAEVIILMDERNKDAEYLCQLARIPYQMREKA